MILPSLSMFSLLALLLGLLCGTGGVVCLWRSWRARQSRSPLLMPLGWALLLLSCVPWCYALGIEFGLAYALMSMTLLAWAVIAATADSGPVAALEQEQQPLRWPAWRTLGRHSGLFLLVVPVAGVVSALVCVGAVRLLPWQPANSLIVVIVLLDHAGFSDGQPGQQFIFSLFRIHFGHFGGLAMKLLFLIGGLALSIVSVTGINVWLHKRKQRDALNNLWPGIVWGTPLALALTALTDVVLGQASVLLFWLTLVAAAVLAQLLNDERRSRCHLQLLTVLLLVAVVGVHLWRYGLFPNPAATGINAGLLLSALLLGWWARVSYRRTPAPVAAADYQAGSA